MNDQVPMSNEDAPTSGHWSLAIHWSLGIDHWSFSSDRFPAPGNVQPAFALFIGFGWIEIVPFVRQVVFFKVRLHLGIGPVKDGADLESVEIRIVRHNIEIGAIGILHFAKR